MQSKNPLVHEVIPIFDIISCAIDKNVADPTLPPAVHVAAAQGRKMLDKYYGLTDDTIVYRIAMCTLLRHGARTHSTNVFLFCSAASTIQGVILQQSRMAPRLDFDCGGDLDRKSVV